MRPSSGGQHPRWVKSMGAEPMGKEPPLYSYEVVLSKDLESDYGTDTINVK